jgi:primosomal protein N' (replication factor Y)
LHSGLSAGEKFDEWRRLLTGDALVAIGARSAVFAPLKNVGVIIIDEEHEGTYQSETAPKYHVRDVASKLAELTGCSVILGSATPDVSTYHAAVNGPIALYTLKERVNRNAMPAITVVDMRAELARGNRSPFSKVLREELAAALNAGNQAILFLNRRGHSTFVSCRVCGYVCACGQCSVNYTYHSYNNKMVCHYCGEGRRPPQLCPDCGSPHIRYFGVGTQRLEEEARAMFPAARMLRMDMDTTSRKNAHANIINQFASGGADVLIGTQMVAKGLNFPNVALVGVVAADTALNTGDYRSAETAFQLITQVAGRAGRASVAGRVVVQAYCPEHYSVEHARLGDYNGFYEQEISLRRQLKYPPFGNLFVVLASCGDERRLIKTLHTLMDIMKRYNKGGRFTPLGPAPAALSKLRGVYRWKVLVKCEDEASITAYTLYCLDKLKANADTNGITWNITLNPTTAV